MKIKSTMDFFFRSSVSKVESFAGVTVFVSVVMSPIFIVEICSVGVSGVVDITISVGVLSVVTVDVIIALSVVGWSVVLGVGVVSVPASVLVVMSTVG